MSQDVECVECSEQLPIHKTNGGCCPSCGGECLELSEIYGDSDACEQGDEK